MRDYDTQVAAAKKEGIDPEEEPVLGSESESESKLFGQTRVAYGDFLGGTRFSPKKSHP